MPNVYLRGHFIRKLLCGHRETGTHTYAQLTENALTGSLNTHTQNRFTALFPGPSGWAGARRNFLLDFYGAGKDNNGKHTDHPVGRHCFQTNLCHPHIFIYAGCPSYRGPPTSSWLGTGTKYAGSQWHGTQWLDHWIDQWKVVNGSDVFMMVQSEPVIWSDLQLA